MNPYPIHLWGALMTVSEWGTHTQYAVTEVGYGPMGDEACVFEITETCAGPY